MPKNTMKMDGVFLNEWTNWFTFREEKKQDFSLFFKKAKWRHYVNTSTFSQLDDEKKNIFDLRISLKMMFDILSRIRGFIWSNKIKIITDTNKWNKGIYLNVILENNFQFKI